MKQWLIAIGFLINASWPFSGWGDETLPARVFRLHTKKIRWRIAMHLIDTLYFWRTYYCMQAYQDDLKRRKLSPEQRDQIEELLRE